jgi:hypothetical protein
MYLCSYAYINDFVVKSVYWRLSLRRYGCKSDLQVNLYYINSNLRLILTGKADLKSKYVLVKCVKKIKTRIHTNVANSTLKRCTLKFQSFYT